MKFFVRKKEAPVPITSAQNSTKSPYLSARERLEQLTIIPVEKRTVLQTVEISAIAHTLAVGVDLGSVLRMEKPSRPISHTPVTAERELGY